METPESIEQIRQRHAELLTELEQLYEGHPDLAQEAPASVRDRFRVPGDQSLAPPIEGLSSEADGPPPLEPYIAPSTGSIGSTEVPQSPVTSAVRFSTSEPYETPIVDSELPQEPRRAVTRAPELPPSPLDELQGSDPPDVAIPQKQVGPVPQPPLDPDYSFGVPDPGAPDLPQVGTYVNNKMEPAPESRYDVSYPDMPVDDWKPSQAKNLNLDDAYSAGVLDPERADIRGMDNLANAMSEYNRNLTRVLETMQQVLMSGIADLEQIMNRFHRMS